MLSSRTKKLMKRRAYFRLWRQRRKNMFYDVTTEPSADAVARMARFNKFINEIRQIQ